MILIQALAKEDDQFNDKYHKRNLAVKPKEIPLRGIIHWKCGGLWKRKRLDTQCERNNTLEVWGSLGKEKTRH